MNEQELRKHYEVFTDTWHLFRKWVILLPLGDEQWQQVFDEIKQIREKHNQEESVKYFMIGAITRLDEIEGRITGASKNTGRNRNLCI